MNEMNGMNGMPDIENMTPEQQKKLMEEMLSKENEGLTPQEIEKKEMERAEKRRKNKALTEETVKICEKGSYEKDGREIPLGLSKAEMAEAEVFMPEDIEKMPRKKGGSGVICSCENRDALSLAGEKLQDPAYGGKVLVLNMASATKPGGGVRDGFGGQEEDLCRTGTLLMSLESEAAKSFYEYGNSFKNHLGTNAVIISPKVAVFRDGEKNLLDKPFEVAVMTCSAPNLRFGKGGKSDEEYEELLYGRIEGMLRCAATAGYENLVLGAFGCGVFKNDAAFVAGCFNRALNAVGGIKRADFAVLCTPGKERNFNEFNEYFGKARNAS